MCCIYLLLQPWVVPSEMLTRNKVHSFLSGHRMFPPQPREHFFGYLLGEAWHFHRDCNTETRGGWRRRSLQSPAPGRKRSSQSQIHGDSSHSAPQQLQPTGARAGSPHPLQAGLIALKEGWIHQHPSSGLFLCRAGVFQLKWGRFSYLGFPKELPRQRRAGKIHHNHRQQTGTGDQPSVPLREFCTSAQALEWQSRILTPVAPSSPSRVALAPLGQGMHSGRAVVILSIHSSAKFPHQPYKPSCRDVTLSILCQAEKTSGYSCLSLETRELVENTLKKSGFFPFQTAQRGSF